MSSATTAFPDGDKDKQTVETNDQSTGSSPSIDPESEKPQLSKESAAVVEDGAAAPQDVGEYATGMKLFIIVVALVLSVFLFSLDQVGLYHNQLLVE
jgi:hypothetical protein